MAGLDALAASVRCRSLAVRRPEGTIDARTATPSAGDDIGGRMRTTSGCVQRLSLDSVYGAHEPAPPSRNLARVHRGPRPGCDEDRRSVMPFRLA
jgi:hypothetical protein